MYLSKNIMKLKYFMAIHMFDKNIICFRSYFIYIHNTISYLWEKLKYKIKVKNFRVLVLIRSGLLRPKPRFNKKRIPIRIRNLRPKYYIIRPEYDFFWAKSGWIPNLPRFIGILGHGHRGFLLINGRRIRLLLVKDS